MNVLITSASRKVWLVQAFQRALAEEGGGRVVAADCAPTSAALLLADRGRLVPRSDAPGFVSELLRVCREEETGLLVPTRDEELGLFASLREEFAAAGVQIVVSPPEAIALCQDKVAFADFAVREGFRVPRRLSEAELSDPARYPVFARTRRGKSSRGAFKVSSPSVLAELRASEGELLVQELVRAQEYTLDVLCDLEGQVLSVVPRTRGTVVAGESYLSRTVREPKLVETGARLAARLGLRGPAVVQAFLPELGEPELIEVNPRFGGATALEIAAGADAPRLLLRMVRGERLQPFLGQYHAGLTMLRYTQDVFADDARLESLRAHVRPV